MIRQQLEKERAVLPKTASKSAAHRFRVGDPMWVLRPQPMGTHRIQTWFTPGEVICKIGEDTYRIKVGPGHFRERHESDFRDPEPDACWKHVSLDYTAHKANSDDDHAEHDNYTVEKILAQRPSASAPGKWSSRCAREAMGRPTTPGNPSVPSCRGTTPPVWSMSAGTWPSSRSLGRKLSLVRLKTWATDPRPELSLSGQIEQKCVRSPVRPLLACSLRALVQRGSCGVVEILRKSSSLLMWWSHTAVACRSDLCVMRPPEVETHFCSLSLSHGRVVVVDPPPAECMANQVGAPPMQTPEA